MREAVAINPRLQRRGCVRRKSAPKKESRPGPARMHVFFSLEISQGSRRVQGSMLWCDVRSNYPVSPPAHYSDSAGRRRRVAKMPRGEPSLLFQQHVHDPTTTPHLLQEFDETVEKGTKASVSRLLAAPLLPLDGFAWSRVLFKSQS